MTTTIWDQCELVLEAKPRGVHLVHRELESAVGALAPVSVGLLHVLIKHTSASIMLGENADPTARQDLANYLDVVAPENEPYFVHTHEGPDDMPAHCKNALIGSDLTIPMRDGKMVLGTWQGLYLCEHRNHAGPRTLVATLHGQKI